MGHLWEKGYYNKGLFILNVIEIMNGNASTSSAYLIDSHDLWHARLGHVNFSYIKKMKELGILENVKIGDNGKCQICSEAKGTKKPCKQVVQRETELRTLIHSYLGDMKSTESRSGKIYYVTFIDDHSRYARVFLLRNKDEIEEKFIQYKDEVENKLDKKD